MCDLLKNYREILAEDINAICQPLAEFGITFFHYMQRFNDHSRIHLSNVPEWIEHFYQHIFYLSGILDTKNDNYTKDSCFLWSTLKNQHIYRDCRDYFAIDYGLTIIKKQAKSVEFFHFGASKDKPEVANFYLSNLDILYKFIIYFKERAAPLLEKARKHRIYVPEYNTSPDLFDFKIASGMNTLDNIPKQTVVNELNVKKYVLNLNNQEIAFSKREVDCLLGMVEGRQAVQIGQKLHISKRTVETHLDHIRQKLACNDKSELMRILMRKGFSFHGQLWQIFS